jgi:L-amino acid N-acyltransferase YncA
MPNAYLMNNTILIRPMKASDWPAVAEIYKQGIATGNATFEQEVPSWKAWDHAHLKTCRLVAEIDGEIAGWAALSGVSGRCVYAGVAEVSVYISENHRGQKLGTLMLSQLIKESEQHNFWTLQAGIFPENEPSLKIHIDQGFRIVGLREKIGKLQGEWRDALMLERRSTITGI